MSSGSILSFSVIINEMALLPRKKMLKIKKITKNVFFMLFLALGFYHEALCDYKPNSTFTKDCLKENKEFVVKQVFDGDTILVGNREVGMGGQGEKKNHKVRLLGIDAYEHDQPLGKSANDYLTKLVLNKNVCIETDVQEKDVYDRTLGYVFQDKKFINEELLKSGNSLLYNFPPNIKYIDRLKKAQIYARQNMLGIWEKQDYILETPSQHRHKTHRRAGVTKKRV